MNSRLTLSVGHGENARYLPLSREGSCMENPEASTELSKERQIMRAMRKTLTSIVRDTAPRDGNASPLCTIS